MEITESLCFIFHGAESAARGLEVLERASVGFEIVAIDQSAEFDYGGIARGQVVATLLAKASRRHRVVAEQHIGLQRPDAHPGCETEIASEADEREAFIGDGRGEAVGLLDAQVRDRRANEHGEDEDTGADSELSFELHGLL
jgi:hypothetical protein